MKFQKRELDHRRLRQQEMAAWNAERASLDDRIRKLEQELKERPIQVVKENLDQKVVAEAQEGQYRAYRARDTAFRALSTLRLIHRDAGNGQCRCGLRQQKCKTVQVIRENTQMESWERQQVELFRRGQRHYLPANHPGLHNRSWTFDVEDEEAN